MRGRASRLQTDRPIESRPPCGRRRQKPLLRRRASAAGARGSESYALETRRAAGHCRANARRRMGEIETTMRPNEGDMVKELNVGDAAPGFSLPTDGEGHASLADLRGKAVVLYFYPKDDTSGCTAEAIAFSGLKAKFAAAGATVVGVSPDNAANSRQVQKEARPRHRAGGRPRTIGNRSLRRLERKEHVRAEVFRGRALDLPHRPAGADRPGLAQGESSGARRRGSGRREGAVRTASISLKYVLSSD